MLDDWERHEPFLLFWEILLLLYCPWNIVVQIHPLVFLWRRWISQVHESIQFRLLLRYILLRGINRLIVGNIWHRLLQFQGWDLCERLEFWLGLIQRFLEVWKLWGVIRVNTHRRLIQFGVYVVNVLRISKTMLTLGFVFCVKFPVFFAHFILTLLSECVSLLWAQ